VFWVLLKDFFSEWNLQEWNFSVHQFLKVKNRGTCFTTMAF